MSATITGHVKAGKIRGKAVKNLWHVVINLGVDPSTGKRQRMRRSVYGKEGDAQLVLSALLVELNQGTYTPSTEHTVASYLREWVKGRETQGLADSTVINNRTDIEHHLIPRIGALKLDQLQPLHIQAIYRELAESGRAASTIRSVHVTLHLALKQALMWQMIRSNPAGAVKPPKVKRKEVKTFGREDLDAFFVAAEASPARDVVLMAYYTGMRRGELLPLKWEDIDFSAGTLHVQRAMTRKQGKTKIGPPKTRRSIRAIALPGYALDLLKELKSVSVSEWVLAKPDGTLRDPSTVSHQFGRIAQKLGMKGAIRFHDLRHTHASLLLAQGVHPKVVQERLGHASIATTMDIYSHVIPSLQREAAATFDSLSPKRHNNGTTPKVILLRRNKK